MRVITGSARGMSLRTLEGDNVRPTTDKVKEAVFSAFQFEIEGRRILDLFAGSGQLGLESLSRGAASATFIDSSREAIDIVKKNAKATGFFDVCRYNVSDWRNYIRKASGRDKYDLVFIDPPYSMECCADALKRLVEADLLEGGAIVVLESGTEELRPEEFSEFDVIKSTHYGKKTFVNILLFKGEA
jgi:16S rRNA (guanine(966)-N(2))-methyltransferase RsmD